MSLAKKLAIPLLGLSLLVNTAFGQKSQKVEGNKGDAHAIVYLGAKDTANIHPIDKNAEIISAVKVYNSLIDFGVKKKNIYFLLPDAKPLFKDSNLIKISDNVKKELRSGYDNRATLKNLENIENIVEKKLDKEDTLIVYLRMHGVPQGFLYSDKDDKSLSPESLRLMLLDNNSKNNLVFVGACYAGRFLKKISYKGLPGSVLIGSSTNNADWYDTDFNPGDLYFEALNNQKDIEKAYEIFSKKYKEMGEAKKPSMLGEYLEGVKDLEEKKQLEEKIKKMDFGTYFKINK